MIMKRFSSGNTAVDMVGTINITGNITPNNWYKRIVRENGKPNLLAIALLSDILFWYRPVEVRDEASGNTIGWKKKFRGQMLQKSYQDYADFFGESKRSIKAALDYLEEIGVIKKVFMDYVTEANTKIPNVMYIDLDPQKLETLTFDEESDDEVRKKEERDPKNRETENDTQEEYIEEDDDKDSDFIELSFGKRGPTKFCTTPYNEMYHPLQINVGGPTTKCTTPLQNSVIPPTTFCGTNTENTTEITNKDINNSINLSYGSRTSVKQKLRDYDDLKKQDGLIDGNSTYDPQYLRILERNLEYESHMKYDSQGDKEMYAELFKVIAQIVCIKRDSVNINGTAYPYEVVKSRFLKLNSDNLEYVMDCMRKTTTKITNIRAYMLTALYNAPDTMEHYYQQEMQHNEYGTRKTLSDTEYLKQMRKDMEDPYDKLSGKTSRTDI